LLALRASGGDLWAGGSNIKAQGSQAGEVFAKVAEVTVGGEVVDGAEIAIAATILLQLAALLVVHTVADTTPCAPLMVLHVASGGLNKPLAGRSFTVDHGDSLCGGWGL
jgi:hypothetical protein